MYSQSMYLQPARWASNRRDSLALFTRSCQQPSRWRVQTKAKKPIAPNKPQKTVAVTRPAHLRNEGAELEYLGRGDHGLQKAEPQAQRASQVVAVHENVNERVQKRRVPGVPARCKPDHCPPGRKESSCVMVHVKNRDLPVVLLEYHYRGVHELVCLQKTRQYESYHDS